ncbi:MAG: tetratricopeptide repeat protein [Aggregatilineales bacterium]
MSGNREVYEQTMTTGDNAAWDHDWKTAISAYAHAIQEIPDDLRAHNNLGLALLQAKRYDDALKVYQRAHQLSPDDPVPLEKSADVLERLGRLKDAAQQYISVADIYLAQRDLDKAIGNWERATRLTPGLLQIHLRLAQSYERIGQRKSAVREYLTLAFNFRANNDTPKALQAVERALRLEPTNPQALNTKQALETGSEVFVPKDFEQPLALEPERKSGFEDDGTLSKVGDSDPRGPLGEATEKALGHLAEFLFEDLSGPNTLAIQGIELQRAGDSAGAISAYQSAEAAGVRNLSLSMCLGSLFVEDSRWDDAISVLTKSRAVPDYTAGAAHGLGLAYYALGQQREAVANLMTALRLVDLSLAMGSEETAQIEADYSSLTATIGTLEAKDLADVSGNLRDWLTGTDWKHRVPETRRLLFNFKGKNEDLSGLLRYGSEKVKRVTEIATNIDRYLRQRLLVLAMDEAYHAIEIVPDYLPVHLRIAQVLMEEGQIQSAIAKYNMVASTFLARNETHRAADILNEVIEIAPTDTGLRSSLIDLLEKEARWPEVLDQYINLADSYYQLADVEQARATYQEAMRLAQRIGSDPAKRAEIMHRVADIDQSRLDLRQALRTYEQIRTIEPNDERARRALIDLNYRLNNSVEAVKELDGLLRLFAQKKRGDQILGILEELVTRMPGDMALRSRLAAVYRQIKRDKDAIAQLDALGELQLEAGLVQDACTTIKQIVAMQPADSAPYRDLLAQLGC